MCLNTSTRAVPWNPLAESGVESLSAENKRWETLLSRCTLGIGYLPCRSTTSRKTASTGRLVRDEAREATGHALEDVEAVMNALAAIAELVDVHFKTRPMPRDANDEMVLEVARNGDADFIVTYNRRDFEPARTLGVAVATPREVLRRLR